MLAVHGPHDEALERQPDGARHQHGHHHRRQHGQQVAPQQQIPLPLPQGMKGAWLLGDAAVEKYRVVAVLVGLAVFALLAWTLSRTKIGLLIRAGVQDREMVEALGYRVRRLFATG